MLTSENAFTTQVENVKVESGPEGYAQFLQAVRELFGITSDLEMELTFDCAEPATGGLLTRTQRMLRDTAAAIPLRDRSPNEHCCLFREAVPAMNFHLLLLVCEPPALRLGPPGAPLQLDQHASCHGMMLPPSIDAEPVAVQVSRWCSTGAARITQPCTARRWRRPSVRCRHMATATGRGAPVATDSSSAPPAR